ncbi:MAG: hypothetical protein O7C67_19220 [Gammaproteobacteria bacterium]|nr:hypothetical protein [Gammaproteobacteria bacterium]
MQPEIFGKLEHAPDYSPMTLDRIPAIAVSEPDSLGLLRFRTVVDRNYTQALRDGGRTAAIHLVVENDITVTTLCNLSGMPAFLVSLGAINALMGLPLDAPLADEPPEYELDPQQLARFVGRYGWENGFSEPVTRFYMADDILYREFRGLSVAASPYAEDGVVVAVERIRFLMDAAGDVWAAASGEFIRQKIE